MSTFSSALQETQHIFPNFALIDFLSVALIKIRA